MNSLTASRLPSGALDPHQAFVEGGPARADIDDRLEQDEDPALVEGGKDFIGRPHVLLALGDALEIGLIGLERAVAPGPGAVERILGAGQHLAHGAGMAGHGQSADRHRSGDRAGGGLHHLVADAGDQAVGGDQQIVRRAIVQHDAELVAGHAPEMILAAQLRVHALGDRGDDLVGDVEPVGLVDAAELIDRGQQESAGGAQLQGFLDGGLENLGQAVTVELAGQGVEARQLGQLLLALAALVDDAHHPIGERGLAVRPGEPPSGILDPDHRRRGCPQRILQAGRERRRPRHAGRSASPRRSARDRPAGRSSRA